MPTYSSYHSHLVLCSELAVWRIDTHHVESNDIAKRNLAGLVPLDEDTIDNLRTAAGRKTEHKWLLRRRVKRIDSAF